MKCPKCGFNSFEFLDNCKKCSSDLTGFKQSHGIRAIVIPFPAAASAAVETGAVTTAAALAAHSPAAAEETFTWEAPPQAPIPNPGDDIFSDLDLGFSAPPKAEPAEETFSFELEPTAEAEPAVAAAEEPGFIGFSFDEPPVEMAEEPPSFAVGSGEDESFAGLLETDGQSDALQAAVAETAGVELESPWDVPTDAFGGFGEEPAPVAPPGEPESTGALDLESFGWEEEEPGKEPAQPAPKGPKVEMEGFSPVEFESLFGEPEEEKK